MKHSPYKPPASTLGNSQHGEQLPARLPLIGITGLSVQLALFLLVIYVTRAIYQWDVAQQLFTRMDQDTFYLTSIIVENLLAGLCSFSGVMLVHRAFILNAVLAGLINVIAFHVYAIVRVDAGLDVFLELVTSSSMPLFSALRLFAVCTLGGLLAGSIRWLYQRRRIAASQG